MTATSDKKAAGVKRAARRVQSMTPADRIELALGLVRPLFEYATCFTDASKKNVDAIVLAKNKAAFERHFVAVKKPRGTKPK